MNNPSLSATADRINNHNDSDAGGGRIHLAPRLEFPHPRAIPVAC
jgi:hypothetical protein